MPTLVFYTILFHLGNGSNLTEKGKWTVVSLIFFTTCLVPMITVIMFRFTKVINDLHMKDRKDRFIPFAFITVFYLVVAYLMFGQEWMNATMVLLFKAIMTVVLLTNLITFVWKISAHAAGVSGWLGFIVAFANGHKIKIKADEYVRIHKAMDRIRFDRNIVDLIINEEVDDVVPLMPEKEIARVRDFETCFWEAFRTKENRLYGVRLAAQQSYEDDRKRIALEFVPTLENKGDASFIFRMLDGKDLRELMLEHICKHISSNTKWDQCAKWMGM